jgi:hypothetical protein
MAVSKEQILTSLEHFKDWNNYLLITTVAAFGWVSAKEGHSIQGTLFFFLFAHLPRQSYSVFLHSR